MAIMLCGLAALLVGCKTRFDSRVLDGMTSLTQITPVDVGTKTVSVSDSVVMNGITATVKMEADYPESGNFFVINSIREWMSEQLGGTYAGNYDNPQEMFDFYKKETLTDYRQNIIPDMPPIEGISAYKDVKFSKMYETEKFVTYLCTIEGYAGGAHGWFISQGQTFRKSDGRRVNFDIFREESKMELADLIKDNVLLQYFEAESDSKESFFFQEFEEIFPLPDSDPMFTKAGVTFTYQQYEVAPYAAGLPTCTIPYDLMDPFLTQAGRNLLETTHVAEY